MKNAEVAEAWVTNCRDAIEYGVGSNQAEATAWAWGELDRLCSEDPFRALNVIELIADLKPEERVMYNLAAGPLEDLLRRHGSGVIEQVEELASKSDAFLFLLGGVWTDRMPPEIQSRVQTLADKSELTPPPSGNRSRH